jgi:putative toxin-antitoxin system antitoxin component (TIGR02293 family)
MLGARPKSAREWHTAISRGVPVRSAEALKQYLQVSEALLAELLGISGKTLSRARKAGANLSAVASDRLFRVARVTALARWVLESDESALNWLRRPQFGLGGQVPIDLLKTSAGTEEVERLLLRIEHGVYS